MYVDHTRPPFIDIPLPPAIILPAYALILLYAIVITADFYLLRNERFLVASGIITPKQLRIAMAVVHVLIPMVFISSHPPSNILFAAAPWFLASYSARIPTDRLTVETYIHTLFRVTVDDRDDFVSKTKVRTKGAAKMALGVFKIAVMHLMIDPLLPRHPDYALEYAWSSPMSMIYTVLFGVKAYCLLGVVDVFMGAEQLVFAWNMVTLFNSPILSASPRDFWSRRWNKVVRNLLHSQVFDPKDASDVDEGERISMTSNTIKEKTPTTKIGEKTENTTQEAVTTTVTTTTTPAPTKRVTRAAAAAAAAAAEKAKAIEAEEDEIKTLSEISETWGHDSVVAHNGSTIIIEQIPKRTFWTTRQGRGLLAFIVSGIFHELIIMSACRHITLENLLFFTLQGLVVMIEVELRQGNLKQEPTGVTRVVCVALQLLFMSITGRLFTAPFLRYHFFPENLEV
ncbi:hypothetical protein [Parasitella parasitica]|uniref:Wax synthase domain-containing protein n=1 Tax=Parasitella parasitica TaxID=35722 RepID=A0A0B7N3W8_9FUNG|nr:hypothetical protein [Parasitella parasitica]